jgi:hypothetical protein
MKKPKPSLLTTPEPRDAARCAPNASRTHPWVSTVLAVAFACTGCQALRYTGPSGERFSRVVIGTQTTLSELEVRTDTNGLRTIRLQGYQSDSSRALGVITEAAVRGAIHAATPVATPSKP